VLNCLTPVSASAGLPVDACERCRSCDRVERNVHVDVINVEPDERASIKIDVIRDVLERTAFRPFEGRRRVVVIRDAETLELAAQHALLKSLEEPPSTTTFFLTTAVPGVLLPTVRSRCMPLRFGRLTEDDVAGVLVRDHGMTQQEARALAALVDGSVGQALALQSEDLAVLREAAIMLLRQAARSSAATLRLQAAAIVAAGPSKERTREELALVLRLVASMLRDIELLNTGADERALANPSLAEELRSLARGFAGARARDAFGAVDRAILALDANAGVRVVSEWVAMQI